MDDDYDFRCVNEMEHIRKDIDSFVTKLFNIGYRCGFKNGYDAGQERERNICTVIERNERGVWNVREKS